MQAANTMLNLQVIEGGTPQAVKIVAIDGVPTTGEPQSETSIVLPPAARAEFVVETPKAGEPAQLVTTEWDTGPQGDRDPTRPIANIVSNDDAVEPAAADVRSDSAATYRPQAPQRAIVQRRLYFSQMVPNPKEGDTSVFYFITVSGQQPAAYRMDQAPNIVVHAGRRGGLDRGEPRARRARLPHSPDPFPRARGGRQAGARKRVARHCRYPVLEWRRPISQCQAAHGFSRS